MKSCFGYVRVSTAKQGDGVSLEVQRDAIEQYAARNDIKIIEWFEEKVTAAKGGRPLFEQMLTRLQQKEADGVVFHKIDRSTRNLTDWNQVMTLHEAGIEVRFAHESFDINSRGGRLAADIQAVVAADFIRNNRSESIKGLYGRLKQGLYPFRAPTGYDDNGKGKPKTIDPIAGPLVRKVFELYATGEYPIWSLVTEMEKRGLRGPTGRPLSKTAIEKMLRNPFYTGVIRMFSNGKSYQGIHEPLISTKLFNQVTAMRHARDNKKSTKHNHHYRGLFKCAHCKLGMIPEKQKGTVYYRCHQKGCPTKTVREDTIDTTILALLQRYTLNSAQFQRLKAYAEKWNGVAESTYARERAQFELTKLAERLTRLTDKFVDDLIDTPTYNQKREQILLEQKRWQADVENQAQADEKLTRLQEILELQKSLVSQYQSAGDQQKREMLKFTTSNRSVAGKKIVLEPSNWMRHLENLADCIDGAPSSTTSRTFDKLSDAVDDVDDMKF